MKKYFFLILNILITISLYAQVSVGDWRHHFAFSNVIQITENSNEIIAGCNNGIFTYNKFDNSINKLTKVNGLSDIGISALDYYEDKDILFVGYSNGNIDIIIDKKIFNIPAIKNKNISAAKVINNVVFKEDFALLSCGFGIIKLDLVNLEIADTYYIGENASLIEVFKIIFDENYFYVATSTGLYTAEINNPNLSDYNNWNKIEDIPNYNSKFTDILFFQDELYTLFYNENSNRKTLYKKTNGLWSVFKQQLNSKSTVYAGTEHLIITTPKEILIYNQNGLNIRNIEHYNDQDVNINSNISYIDNDGNFWIGDKYLALVLEDINYAYSIIKPNGPSSNDVLRIESSGDIIVATQGGFASTGVNNWNPGTSYIFAENTWTNIVNSSAWDYFEIAINPNNQSNFFIGSWGHGIIEYKETEFVEVYNEENSTLQSIFPGANYIRIGGLSFDNQNNLWSFNSAKDRPVNVKKPDGTWQSFSFGGLVKSKHASDLIITQDDIIWVQFKSTDGIFIFNPNNTLDNTDDDEYKKLYPTDAAGNTIGQELYSIAEDLDGNIWIGSNEGVAVYNNPQNFNEDDFYINKVKITGELNDTFVTGYLLENELVRAIEVDGGNRKWFGTQNSGVYLMSEDCTKELLHFTTENSPLPSNTIYTIAVNNATGEVFFGTKAGIISYRGNATAGSDEFEDVYVFPNPVRNDYYGEISITGLVENVNIKITDITGNIVFETTALGGQATWDGNNFSGQRVQTGVYLVFCSNEDGTKTHVTKLLFIN